MIAEIGDRIILEAAHLGDLRRIGVITAITHADGGPPYEVRWLDDGRTTLIFFPVRRHGSNTPPCRPAAGES
nr:hypothetical protein GCM10020092_052060 [Actinoplanes digitatis]